MINAGSAETAANSDTKVLDGVRVLEVAEFLMTPSAGAVLSEWGADVIKVEHARRGDPLHTITSYGISPPPGESSPLWEVCNGGKRSVGIDLATEAGRAVLLELAATADVFLTNFLPRTLAKHRIGPADIREVNERIIYARGSANGPHGPDAGKGGFDILNYWHQSGTAVGAMPRHGKELIPMPGPGYGDIQTGMVLAAGICGALFARERTGRGSVVDVSLLGAGCWAMGPALLAANVGKVEELQHADRWEPANPLANEYLTKDGRYLALHMLQSDRYWRILCPLIGRPELTEDPRFNDAELRHLNRRQCVEELDAAFAKKDLEEWKEILGRQDGQWAVVQRVGDLNRDVQARANGYVQDIVLADGVRQKTVVASPVHFDEKIATLRPAPEHAQHTEEVLLELGHDWDSIEKLKAAGAIS